MTPSRRRSTWAHPTRLDLTWQRHVDFSRLQTTWDVQTWTLYIQGGAKNGTIFVRLTTSLNINRFSKFFYCQNQETICNKAITTDLTTTKVCHYTTLWNVSVLRITIKNKTTFVATHFKKLTTETTCLLSKLLSKKSHLTHLTVFTSKCLRLAAGRRIQPATPLTNGAINQTLRHFSPSATMAFFSWLIRQHW